MLRSAPPTSSYSIHIKDHALVLFLPQPEQQSLWRFDLDGLIEQAFRLTGREGYYVLTLDDLDGSSKIIARFVDKGQAEHVINALYEALTSHAGAGHADPAKPADTRSFWQRWFGWLTFWRFIFLLVVGLITWRMISPPSADSLAQRIMQEAPLANVTPGVPLDVDDLLK